mgnify:CR=1 FL=1
MNMTPQMKCTKAACNHLQAASHAHQIAYFTQRFTLPLLL